MATKFIFGQCDCCGKINRVLRSCVWIGMDTSACTFCADGDKAEDADDLSGEIDRLLPKAETGEQFAHICALECALVELTA